MSLSKGARRQLEMQIIRIRRLYGGKLTQNQDALIDSIQVKLNQNTEITQKDLVDINAIENLHKPKKWNR